jgi:hypothetical protein
VIDLGTEQQVRLRLAVAVFLLLPFGVGLWTFFDPVGPSTGPAVDVRDLLKPFFRGSDLDEVQVRLREAFQKLDEAHGPDSPHHALALIRRGELRLYQVDFHQAEKDLRAGARLGGCAEVDASGAPSSTRSRPFEQGGLLETHCADAWALLSEVLRETERSEEGLRYLRAQLALKRALVDEGSDALGEFRIDSLRKALKSAAEIMRDQGRGEEAEALEAEASGLGSGP